MKEHLSPSLALLVAFFPIFADASERQRSYVGTIDLNVAAELNTTPGSQSKSALSGHFDVSTDGITQSVDSVITVGDRTATLQAKRGSIRFGDGYSIDIKALADTNVEQAAKIILTTPDGEAATATLLYNKITGQASTTGLEAVRNAFASSGDAALVRSALPTLTAALKDRLNAPRATPKASATSGQRLVTPSFEVGTDAWGWCVLHILLYMLSVTELILACGVPEPLEPLACTISILGFTGEGLAVAEACSGP